jgi:septal ring factor EnvC (AmiA/AmiB activator)
MKGLLASLAVVVMLALPASSLDVQKADYLTEEEHDKLREAQEPSQRIGLYLDFAQARLDRFEGFRSRRTDPQYDNGSYLDSILAQYISLTDELKNWIDYEYERQGDMRHGLSVLLERGPRQLEVLRHIQQTPDTYTNNYSNALRDALDDLKDALDGATKALADQQKTFVDAKREQRAEKRTSKERAKEEKKRTKEEKKLQKQERKRRGPVEPHED